MRKTIVGSFLATAIAAAFLVGVAAPAHAATAWFVRTGGLAANNCTSAATACPTITSVLAKATFAAGDTIDVGPGTFTEHPVITKAVTITGAGASTTPGPAVTTINGGGTAAAPINTFIVAIPVANPNQSVVINNLSITGGVARLGGGIQLQAGNLSLSDDVIYNNTAGATTLGSGSFGGGAIATFGKVLGASSTVALVRTTITGNKTLPIGTASVPGAGVFLLSPLTAVDSTISNNVITAGTSGGTNAGAGIYASKLAVADTTSIDADHTTFSGNIDNGGLGGAIGANSGAPITIKNNSTMSGNSAVDGAAIFTSGPHAVSILNSTVSTNAVTFQGGAVFMQQAAGTDVTSFTATGSTFSGNTAANAGGGVILYPGVTSSITGGSFSNNAAPFGAGLYVVKGASATATGTAFTSNTARSVGNSSGNGGAIYNSGSFTMDGGSFTTNVANGVPASGTAINSGIGGAVLNQGALVVKNGTVFSGNQALASPTAGSTITGWGGSIYSGPLANNDAPTTSITGATFNGGGVTSNAAVGGAIATSGNLFGATLTGTSPATLTASGDTFANLIATTFAGGVYHGGASSATIDASSFTGSNAVVGGALEAASTLALTNSTVDSNTALLGGGIYVPETATLSITGSTLNNNSALGGSVTANLGDGGGIFNSGNLTVTRSTISNNKAVPSTGSGAGQPARGNGFGGGIYAGSAANNAAVKTTINASTFNGNSAATGGAIVNWTASGTTGQTNPLSITNSTISNNTTTGSGSIVGAFPTSIVSSTIANNTAPAGQFGSVFLVTGSRVAGSIFSANTAFACGILSIWVAPADGGYNQSDPGDNSCGFTPAKNDISALPQLGALANNGGPTQTRLPGNSSPVINVIPTSTATGITDAVTAAAVTLCGPGALDQRGNTRPSGDSCDIGSVEIGSSAPTISGPSSDTVTVGTPVSYSFSTTGIPTPTITISGSLPNGVNFASTPGSGTATISGTPLPGSGNTYTVILTAANGASPNATKTFTLTVNEGPTLTGPSAATYTVGAAGAPQTFTATSSPTASLSETGALPDGVTFVDNGDGTATLSGTPLPTMGGAYPIVVKATNGVGTDPTLNFTLTVNEAPSVAGATSLTFTAGTAITPENYATVGYPEPGLSAAGVPDGLTFADNGDGTGTLSGIPGAASGGLHTMTITAVNGVGSSATLDVSITINQAPQLSGPSSRTCQVLTACGPDTFIASGYPGSTLTLTGDALPSGMTFSSSPGSSTGTIDGTPDAATGGVYNITVNADNGVGAGAIWAYQLTVGQPATVSGPTSATYTVGSSGADLDYTTTGFPTPTLSATGLPDGVTLTDHGNGTATIGGTPDGNTGGVKTVVITATNGIGAAATTTLTLTVNEAPHISGPTSATYVVGSAGAPQTFTAAGYPLATLSEVGALPDGVTFVDNGDGNATISGVPHASTGGVYPITVTASNGIGAGAIWSFTLTVNEAPTILGPSEARFEIDTLSSVDFASTGFPTPGLTLVGDLPSGVGFLDNGDGTGTLIGTPDSGTEGVYPVTITADNGVTPAATLTFVLTVVAPVTVTTGDLTDAAVGTPYSKQLTAVGGVPPYTWSIVGGALPAGLTLSPSGVISGAPTGPASTATFTVRAADSLLPIHAGTKVLTLVVGRGATTLAVAPAVLKLQPLGVTLLTVSATLTGPVKQPLGGQTITFYAGVNKLCTAVTDATGKAGCSVVVKELSTVLHLGNRATYAGSTYWQPATGAGGLIG